MRRTAQHFPAGLFTTFERNRGYTERTVMKMHSYISILRGINVGSRQLRMEDLRNLYETLGFQNVQTYIQSGNVIFQARKTAESQLAAAVSGSMKEALGWEVPVIVLRAEARQTIVQDNPYRHDPSKDPAYLHVTFLAGTPENPARAEKDLALKAAAGEAFSLSDRAVYLYCPKGYGTTKLSNTFLEKQLKVTATTRNWKTTQILLEMAIKQ
jgi:uncharacterized protein (DUF1697 family)